MDWQFQPEKRNRQEKLKDIRMAKLQRELSRRLQTERNNKRIIAIFFVHIIVLLIVIPIAAIYATHMTAKMDKPDHCKYYSLDVSMDLKAKCQVCEEGFIKQEKGMGCVQVSQ